MKRTQWKWNFNLTHHLKKLPQPFTILSPQIIKVTEERHRGKISHGKSTFYKKKVNSPEPTRYHCSILVHKKLVMTRRQYRKCWIIYDWNQYQLFATKLHISNEFLFFVTAFSSNFQNIIAWITLKFGTS